jgi:tellurite resistance protein TehA-like permease
LNWTSYIVIRYAFELELRVDAALSPFASMRPRGHPDSARHAPIMRTAERPASHLQEISYRFGRWADHQIESLQPGCFAFVMATGIISNALLAENVRALSNLLFAGNTFAYAWLAALTILRAVRFPGALCSDLMNPRCVFSFFTVVAGSNVLGEGFYLRGFATTALCLWLFALLLWFILFYFSFAVWIFVNAGTGADALQGGWLLAIVGTESLTVLGASVASPAQNFGPAIVVLIYMLWGVGLGLYAIYIALFAYRILFFRIEPDDLSPALWVVMGAAAISTVAGSALLETATDFAYLNAMRPLVAGVTLILWAWASLWIPLLLLMGAWKHGIRRRPLVYTVSIWSIVFPLGMYSVATLRLALAGDFSALRALSGTLSWIALAAWLVSFAGLVRASLKSFNDFGRLVPDAKR